jgi:hypothetical protein
LLNYYYFIIKNGHRKQLFRRTDKIGAAGKEHLDDVEEN